MNRPPQVCVVCIVHQRTVAESMLTREQVAVAGCLTVLQCIATWGATWINEQLCADHRERVRLGMEQMARQSAKDEAAAREKLQ